jgi:hypothetical protein
MTPTDVRRQRVEQNRPSIPQPLFVAPALPTHHMPPPAPPVPYYVYPIPHPVYPVAGPAYPPQYYQQQTAPQPYYAPPVAQSSYTDYQQRLLANYQSSHRERLSRRNQNVNADNAERQLHYIEEEREHRENIFLHREQRDQQILENQEAEQIWHGQHLDQIQQDAAQQQAAIQAAVIHINDNPPSPPPPPALPPLPLARRSYQEPFALDPILTMTVECSKCHALHFLSEKLTASSARNPKFSTCCLQGKVDIPPFSNPPAFLLHLLQGLSPTSRAFRDHIRQYNAAFAFTSVAVKLDDRVVNASGPYSFRIHGGLYHQMGSLIPPPEHQHSYAQLYILDPQLALDERNRRNPNLAPSVMLDLQTMLLEINPFVPLYKQVCFFFLSFHSILF